MLTSLQLSTAQYSIDGSQVVKLIAENSTVDPETAEVSADGSMWSFLYSVILVIEAIMDAAGMELTATDTGLEWIDSAPHNNLQPYFTVYIWKRTA